ncbi:MAG TPA: polysaccharide pyruvyl transferase family protein, partial [Candidatus Nitrosotalea sp.]|nr:polysaccharide pyruvyl transferase family protein [Candidatus Nitrosotalea sp.]
MTRVLFVTNGHGEAAIAERVAAELHRLVPAAELHHLALVGDPAKSSLRDVGPRRPMPSGGLIAMGNARNIAQDLRAGLLALTAAQLRFLRRVRGAYDVVVAVGDVYALTMARFARTRTVFVGSAKSVNVAPYGRFESRVLARAEACFVRDDATAEALRRRGVEASVANAIVDLFASDAPVRPPVEGFSPAIALFPGSRESAYDDAEFLLELTRELAIRRPALGAVLSIAPGLEPARFAEIARGVGLDVRTTDDESIPFALGLQGREIVRAWRGPLGPVLERVAIVLGQAGTANEAAASAGVAVAAFERDRDRKARWYRQRQRGLLGEALAVFSGELDDAVAGID